MPNVTLETMYLILYTSGTTGIPKGALITQNGMASAVASLHYAQIDLNETDIHLSWLPLAHIFEREFEGMLFCMKGCIGSYSGDIKNMKDDIANLRLTVLPSVPRIFNRIYETIKQKVGQLGFLKKMLFDYAYKTKLNDLHKKGKYTNCL